MKLKNTVIYCCLAYAGLYIGSAFLEMHDMARSYKSMTSTVQMAAEMAVQGGLSSAESLTGDGVLWVAEEVQKAIDDVDAILKEENNTTDNAVDIVSAYMDKVEREAAGKVINVSPLSYALDTTNYYNFDSGSAENFLKEAVENKEVTLKYIDMPISYWVHGRNTGSDKGFFEMYNTYRLLNSDLENIVSGHPNSIYLKYKMLAHAELTDKKYNKVDWKAIVPLGSRIATCVEYTQIKDTTASVWETETLKYMQPSLLSMGAKALSGANLNSGGGCIPGFTITTNETLDALNIGNTLKTYMKVYAGGVEYEGTPQARESVINKFMEDVLVFGVYEGSLEDIFNKVNYEDYKDLDTLTADACYTNGGMLPLSNYIIEVPGSNKTALLKFHTATSAVNSGVTYLDRQELQQLFVDNMTKLMLGSKPSTANIGFICDENGDSFIDACEKYDNYSQVPNSTKEGILTGLLNNVINDGDFNFVRGKLSESSITSTSDAYWHNLRQTTFNTALNPSGFTTYYKSSPSDTALKENLPVIEYKLIDVCDTSAENKALLYSIYKDANALQSAIDNAVVYIDGENKQHKYVLAAKVTFFADVSVNYKNPFVRDAVYVAASAWSDSSTVVDGNTINYKDSNANNRVGSQITDAAGGIIDTTAALQNLHTFDLNNVADLEYERYSPITDNILYEYTTYVAVTV